ncbi:Rid family hydrolase [Acidocella sp.]|uniref:Rid family hydrolase n=1 Tax=Acidocella sp. TaxID=50710 RepID=UPI002633445F|nr:Rid family hydrolase [Acidocella sp.]
MSVQKYFSGGRFEAIGSYARGKRVGPYVFIAGTTAINEQNEVHAPGDAYEQTIFIMARIEKALHALGADLTHVVRTTAFLSNMQEGVMGFVKAHGEVFKGIDPVSTGVEAGLTRPGMMVELQVDAIIHDETGNILAP